MKAETMNGDHDQRRAANMRTALVLLSIALAFFVGIVLKRWLFGG